MKYYDFVGEALSHLLKFNNENELYERCGESAAYAAINKMNNIELLSLISCLLNERES